MKKLNLNLQLTENAELLTRSQLKNVLGGGPLVLSTDPNCIPRNQSCDKITEETDCCGSGQCLAVSGSSTGWECL
jgi:hypothetical protein